MKPVIASSDNIYKMVQEAAKFLRATGQRDKARDMTGRVLKAQTIPQALSVIKEYVEVK